jgi:hypothetical protein
MAGFFESLLNLGEEKPAAAPAVGRDLESLSQPELVALCGQLQQRYTGKCADFDRLHGEAMALRQEHDAFRARAESWQAQMKVLREDDRRLIEQLRGAGQAGEDTDAVMTDALQATVAKLKEELRAVQGERDREARRRSEAELAAQRLATEHQREVNTLRENVEALKLRMRQAGGAAGGGSGSGGAAADDGDRGGSGAHRAVRSLSADSSESTTGVGAATEPAAAASASGAAAGGRGGAVQLVEKLAAAESSLQALLAQVGEGEPATAAASAAAAAVAAARVAAAFVVAEANALTAGAAASRSRVQQLEQELLDGGTAAAQLRSQVGELQTRVASLVASAEEKDAAFGAAKRQWGMQTESQQQAVESERALRTKAVARLEATIEAMRAEVAEAQRLAAAKDQQVTDAAAKGRAVSAEVESERAALQATLLGHEARVQEATARRLATEAALGEAQAELRRRSAAIDELRVELDRAQQRCDEAEGQVLVAQQAAGNREREVRARAARVQALEAEVDSERREAQQQRERAEALAEALAAAQAKVSAAVNVRVHAARALDDVSSPVAGSAHEVISRGDVAGNASALRSPSPPGGGGGGADDDAERWASATREWLSRLDHERRVAAEAVRVRQEQSARLRQLEMKLDEMTFKLATAEATAAAATSAASSAADGAAIAIPPAATASSVLLSHNAQWPQQIMPAMQRLSGGWLTQRRALIAFLCAFFLCVLAFNWSAAAQNNAAIKAGDLETITDLKEKYFKCLDAVARCKPAAS